MNKKNKKPSYDEIYKRFKSKGLVLIDNKIFNSKQKLTCVDSEGYFYSINYNNLSSNKKPERFNKFNPFVMQNIQKFLDDNNSGTKIISKNFKGSKDKLKFICPQCNKEFERSWQDIYIKKRFLCKDCVKEKSNGNGKKYKLEYVKGVLKDNGYILLNDKYSGNTENLTCIDKDGYKVHIKFSYVLNKYNRKPLAFSPKYNGENYIYNINNYFKINNINCKALYYQYENDRYDKEIPVVYCKCECGNIFHTNFASIKDGQYRCQKCSKSQSNIEHKVQKWLDSKHILYECQKKFDDCVGEHRKLPFDFYLPKYNLCIEVDGSQHYKPVYFSVEDKENATHNLEKRQNYDNIKTKYCKEHNIKLLRIKEEDIKNRNENYKKILYDKLIKK